MTLKTEADLNFKDTALDDHRFTIAKQVEGLPEDSQAILYCNDGRRFLGKISLPETDTYPDSANRLVLTGQTDSVCSPIFLGFSIDDIRGIKALEPEAKPKRRKLKWF